MTPTNKALVEPIPTTAAPAERSCTSYAERSRDPNSKLQEGPDLFLEMPQKLSFKALISARNDGERITSKSADGAPSVAIGPTKETSTGSVVTTGVP